MGRINVYLPDELEAIMRARDLSPSELLQDALQQQLTEKDRQELSDAWLAEAAAAHGPPTAEDEAWADSVFGPLDAEERRAS